jgi:predicted ABC-type ATPase
VQASKQAGEQASKPKADAAPDVVRGDVVFARHPIRGPISLRVTAAGKDGFRGVCDQGAKHGVPYADYLGHKARAASRYDVVEEGADGSILRDASGATRFMQGGIPASAAPTAPNKPEVPGGKDDPLLDGLGDITKALLDMPEARIPAGAMLMLKAGPIKGRAGLVLAPVTDKDGHQTHRWESTGAKPEPGERERKPAMKHGDHVAFKHGDVEGHGKIVGSGADGVTLEGEDGQRQHVRHEHLTGHAEGGMSGDGDGPVDPEKFSGADFAAKHDDANATPESVLARFPPEVAGKIEAVEADIAKAGTTMARHKKDGAWTPERIALHDKILEKFLSPEKIAAATPPEGQAPTFTILGGRGGSGKSWFKGKVYEEDHAIVLGADEIKGEFKSDGYDGWNAAEYHEESGELFDQITEIAFNSRLNIVHDATMKTPEKALALVKKFKEAGYRVEAHYMHLPRQEAANRAVKRFLGKAKRYVPPSVVLSNTKNEASFDSVRPHVDAWSFRDNNVSEGQEPRLISEKNDGRGPIRDGLSAGVRSGAGSDRTGAGAPEKAGGGGKGGSPGGGFPAGHRGHYEPSRQMEKAFGGGVDGYRLLLPTGDILKGLLPGVGDLFSQPVNVTGHMRGGSYVAPYASKRMVLARRPAPHPDLPRARDLPAFRNVKDHPYLKMTLGQILADRGELNIGTHKVAGREERDVFVRRGPEGRVYLETRRKPGAPKKREFDELETHQIGGGPADASTTLDDLGCYFPEHRHRVPEFDFRPRPDLEGEGEARKVPSGVLRQIKQQIEWLHARAADVKKWADKGALTAAEDTLEAGMADIEATHAFLVKVRGFAEKNGVNMDKLVSELGGLPDFDAILAAGDAKAKAAYAAQQEAAAASNARTLSTPPPAPAAEEPQHIAVMRERLAAIQARKSKTYADETLEELYGKRLGPAGDPDRWEPGQGVSYQVASGGRRPQTNRGFRIIAIHPEDRQASIRSVADTGLTSSGGNHDRIEDQRVYLGELRRDRKYDQGGVSFRKAEGAWAAGDGVRIEGLGGGFQVVGIEPDGRVQVRQVEDDPDWPVGINFDDPVITWTAAGLLRRAPELDAPAPDEAAAPAGFMAKALHGAVLGLLLGRRVARVRLQ